MRSIDTKSNIRTNLGAFGGWQVSKYGDRGAEVWPKDDQLALDLQVDMVVVGAGISGLSAALNAVTKGLHVCVLDGNRPGWNATGRSLGIVSMAGFLPLYTKLLGLYGLEKATEYYRFQRLAYDYFSSLSDELGPSAQKVECGYTQLAVDAQQTRNIKKLKFQLQEYFGYEVSWSHPQHLLEMGFDGSISAALYEKNAFGINPLSFSISLINRIRSKGAGIHFQTPMLGFRDTKKEVEVITPHAKITAKKLILASGGAYQENLRLGPVASLNVELSQSVLMTSQLEDESGLPHPYNGACAGLGAHEFVRILPDKSVMFSVGMTKESAKNPASAHQKLHQLFIRYFPKWERLKVEKRWESRIFSPKNLSPYVGRIKENSWACCGFGSFGLAGAAFSGAQAVEAMIEGSNALPGPMKTARRSLIYRIKSWFL